MRPRSVFVPSQLLDLADAIGFDPREAIKLTVARQAACSRRRVIE
jgi:hypothetical protein